MNYQFASAGGCQTRVNQGDEVLWAFDAFSKVRDQIDDVADLKRKLRGAGVLEFHIIVEYEKANPPPDVAEMIDRLQRRLVARVVAQGHVVHPGPLELDRVDTAGDDQVVAQGDAVTVLLGGPAADPGAPGAVAAEPGGDLAVVRRQVVLGQQVGDHRCLGGLGEP